MSEQHLPTPPAAEAREECKALVIELERLIAVSERDEEGEQEKSWGPQPEFVEGVLLTRAEARLARMALLNSTTVGEPAPTTHPTNTPEGADYLVTLARDGDRWCGLLGENLQDGHAGFAATPTEALRVLANEWEQAEAAHAPDGREADYVRAARRLEDLRQQHPLGSVTADALAHVLAPGGEAGGATRDELHRKIAFECMERILMHDDRQDNAGVSKAERVLDYAGIYAKARDRVLRRAAPDGGAPRRTEGAWQLAREWVGARLNRYGVSAPGYATLAEYLIADVLWAFGADGKPLCPAAGTADDGARELRAAAQAALDLLDSGEAPNVGQLRTDDFVSQWYTRLASVLEDVREALSASPAKDGPPALADAVELYFADDEVVRSFAVAFRENEIAAMGPAASYEPTWPADGLLRDIYLYAARETLKGLARGQRLRALLAARPAAAPDDGRASLAQEIRETLQARGCWVPASTAPVSDLIHAVGLAVDRAAPVGAETMAVQAAVTSDTPFLVVCQDCGESSEVRPDELTMLTDSFQRIGWILQSFHHTCSHPPAAR